MKMDYYDSKSDVHLEAYSDTVVLEQDGDKTYLAAIRFGGYPESVRGMSEAIYGGGAVTLDISGNSVTVSSYVKRYRREHSHDGIYAEAILLIQDDEQRTDRDGDDENISAHNRPRKCYFFCEQGDSDRLFEELDKKTAVPLIPDFKEYILTELQNRNILKPLRVISRKEKFDTWVLILIRDRNTCNDMGDML